MEQTAESGRKEKPQRINLKRYLDELEVEYIRWALGEAGGVRARAAELLCLQRTALVMKLKKWKRLGLKF